MSVKRLKHHAHTLGEMFCSWELMFDYKRLAELEKGTLRIDMLREECFHDGTAIQPLHVVGRLRKWMIRDLKDHNFALDRLEAFDLCVTFTTHKQFGQTIERDSWNDVTNTFVFCSLDCRSRVKTGTREFTAAFCDEKEWPETYSWIR